MGGARLAFRVARWLVHVGGGVAWGRPSIGRPDRVDGYCSAPIGGGSGRGRSLVKGRRGTVERRGYGTVL